MNGILKKGNYPFFYTMIGKIFSKNPYEVFGLE